MIREEECYSCNGYKPFTCTYYKMTGPNEPICQYKLLDDKRMNISELEEKLKEMVSEE